MQVALKLSTTVRSGHRLDVPVPELPEGAEVELIVLSRAAAVPASERRFQDVVEFLDSLPRRKHTPEEWAAMEEEFRRERDSWDR